MKKTISIAVALILIVSSQTSFSAGLPDEQYLFTYSTVFPDRVVPDKWFGAWFSDKPNYPSIPELTATGQNGERVKCDSIDEPNCKDLKTFSYVANYPFCSGTQTMDCIEEIFAIADNGKRVVATNIEYLPKNPTLVNRSSYFHPGGSSKEIFDLPGVVHKGGSSKYAVEVMKMGSFTIFDRSIASSGYSSFDPSFYVALTPVNMNPGSFELINEIGVQPAKFDRKCVVLDVNRCGMAQGFPTGHRFGVSIRMNKQIYGWLQGRMQEPVFTSERISAGVKISVTGYPTIVPSISGGGNYSTRLTPSLQAKYKKFADAGSYPSFDNFTADGGSTSLKAFEEWMPVLGDKATVMPSIWSFRNIKKDEFLISGLRAGQCIVSAMKTGIGGMVSTNATAYSSGPPIFNEETQSLDYKVAAPHFDSKGEEFRGYYNLKITAETARCIYGFGSVPIRATVSVVNPSGEKVISTSTLKSDDKWLELTAANFGFSSPTIRVKLSQEIQGATNTPQPQETAKKKETKSTILCIKGKTTKKVTAIKPTCPKGFKKKS